MRAGRAGDRDQQSQCRRTRGRAGRAVAHTDCPGGTRPGQCGRCRRARMGPAAAGEATWATSGQESHPTQWPITRLPISPTVSDRPTDHTRNWHDYNGRVRDWIARLLQTPGAVSFLAYRTADGSSPNTMTLLEFRTLAEARTAIASEPLKAILQEIRST